MGSREEVAHHHGVATCTDRLGDVSAGPDATVRDERNVVTSAGACTLGHGRELWYSDSRNDTGRTDGSRPHADLDRIGTRRDQILGAGRGGDIARDDVDIAHPLAHLADRGERLLHVTVRDVEDQGVRTGVHQRFCALQIVAAHADRSGHHQPPALVLCGVGALLELHQIAKGDEPDQASVIIDEGQLLDTRIAQDQRRLVRADADRRHDQPIGRCHDLRHTDRGVLTQQCVTPRQDADRTALCVDDNEPVDTVCAHLGHGALKCQIGPDRERVVDDECLGTFDACDLRHLLLDQEETMDDADASGARHRDRHRCFGDRIHVGRDDRRSNADTPGKPRGGVDVGPRCDWAALRDEEHIVIRERERQLQIDLHATEDS